MDLISVVQEWQTLRQKRKELDDLSKEFKKLEETKKGEILNHLTSLGQDGVKLTGVGNIYKTINLRVRNDDAEKICRRMFEDMKTIEKNNALIADELQRKPLCDALLFQKTPLQEGIKKILEEMDFADWNEKEQYAHDILGVNLVQDVDLSFRKG